MSEAQALASVARYLAPTSLAQALAALADRSGAIVLAGGTDLMPQSRAGRVRAAHTLLNIRRVAGLDALALDGDTLRLGALTTVATLRRHPLVRAHAGLLAEAADHFASDQIRHAATLGGNVCNASPAGDLLTPLLALDAEVELARLADDGSIHTRWLALAEFFTGPARTRREAHELLTAVRLQAAPQARQGLPARHARFYKSGTRPALCAQSQKSQPPAACT